jgi:hypothetical protein
MFTGQNKKQCLLIVSGLAAILLIVSAAQAASNDRTGRSSNRNRQDTAARAAQRDSRSASDSAKTDKVEKSQPSSSVQTRSEQSNTRASENAGSRGSRVERKTERPTFAAPQVSAPVRTNIDARPAPQVSRQVPSPPITRPVESAQPQFEQSKTITAEVKVAPSTEAVKREETKRISSPMARRTQSAKTPAKELPSSAVGVRVAKTDAPTANIQKADKPKTSERSAVVQRTGQNTNNDRKSASQSTRNSTRLTNERPQRLAPTNPIKMAPTNPISPKPESPQRLTSSTKERLTVDRTQRREKIIRGTAGNEVSVPTRGKLMDVERAVTAVDGRTGSRKVNNTTVINNNTTVVNNVRTGSTHYDGRWWSDRHNDYDRRRWNGGHHNDHHSNFFLSFNFSSGYYYDPWSPILYEPAFCTTVAYTAGPAWPCSYRTIYYGYGPYYSLSYVYPSYHRRYLFVSVGGYWPSYPCARYYWYGCHPWYWYGPTPVAYSLGGDTYNYYTYNYPDTGSDTGGALTPGSIVNGVEVPDYDALHAAGRSVNIPAQLPQQLPAPEQPAQATESDELFDEGVQAFADANYAAAIEKFQRAVRLEPNDVILPFAYCQALFANNDYEQAAAVLRTALNAMAPAKPEVFFPRGLYKDDNVLTAQIKNLERAVMMNPTNPELQLLYGYELLGIGKIDEAKTSLEVAKRNARTAAPAGLLLNLIERVEQEANQQAQPQ